MARLSPLHDAVPRVGGFLNAVVGVVERPAEGTQYFNGHWGI
jgi:hypothetical protein